MKKLEILYFLHDYNASSNRTISNNNHCTQEWSLFCCFPQLLKIFLYMHQNSNVVKSSIFEGNINTQYNYTYDTNEKTHFIYNSEILIVSLIITYSTDEIYGENPRNLALIILKNIMVKDLMLKNFNHFWILFAKNVKDQIKMASLALLASKSQKIQSAANMILSEITKFLLYARDYAEFLNLTDNLFNIFISQQLNNFDNSKLDIELIREKLKTLEIKTTALNALRIINEEINSIFFVDNNFHLIIKINEMKVYMNKIIQVIVANIHSLCETHFLLDINMFSIPNKNQTLLTYDDGNSKSKLIEIIKQFNKKQIVMTNNLLEFINSSLFFFHQIFTASEDANEINNSKNEPNIHNQQDKFQMDADMIERYT